MKMIILQTYTFLLNVALSPFGSVGINKCSRIFRDVSIFLSFVMWFTLAFVDYIININNFMEACIPLIMVKGHVIIITIQWQLVLNQYRYKSLLDNLQSIVDESMLELLDLCQFRT